MSGKKRKITFSSSKLKEVLELKNITYNDLSIITNASLNTINKSMWQASIMPDILETICKYLDISIYYLIDEKLKLIHASKVNEELLKNRLINSKGYLIPSYFEGSIESLNIEETQKLKNYFLSNYAYTWYFEELGINLNDIETEFPGFYDDLLEVVQESIIEYIEETTKERKPYKKGKKKE